MCYFVLVFVFSNYFVLCFFSTFRITVLYCIDFVSVSISIITFVPDLSYKLISARHSYSAADTISTYFPQLHILHTWYTADLPTTDSYLRIIILVTSAWYCIVVCSPKPLQGVGHHTLTTIIIRFEWAGEKHLGRLPPGIERWFWVTISSLRSYDTVENKVSHN